MVAEAKRDTIIACVNSGLVKEGCYTSVLAGHIALYAEGLIMEVRQLATQ